MIENLIHNHWLEIIEIVAIAIAPFLFGGFYLRLKSKMTKDFATKMEFKLLEQRLEHLSNHTQQEFKDINNKLSEIQKDVKELIKKK